MRKTLRCRKSGSAGNTASITGPEYASALQEVVAVRLLDANADGTRLVDEPELCLHPSIGYRRRTRWCNATAMLELKIES
jgi:hypothetical protein